MDNSMPTIPFENDDSLLEEVRSFFAGDAFAFQTVGMEILAAAQAYALLKMPLGPHLHNAKGGVQGGALFTLADMAVAVADYKSKEVNLTLDGNIQYLSVPQGSALYAYAYPARRGRTIAFYRVDISDEKGELVAIASFSYFHHRLSNEGKQG